MGRSSTKQHHRAAHTLPSSPTHSSSSSSDFEFTVSISPRKSSPALCPADELFYKGQLLPLQLSPRLSMVRTLLLSSSSSSSSATTSARDSSGSSSDFSSLPEGGSDSSRPSSVTDQDDELKRLHTFTARKPATANKSSYFSLPKLFRKDPKPREPSPAKRIISSSAKEVIRKYLKKVKPLYEKLSQKQQQQIGKTTVPTRTEIARSDATVVVSSSSCKGGAATETGGGGGSGFPLSFSGNLKYPASRTRTSAASSCPSSMRSSPSHSGVLSGGGFPASTRPNRRGTESAIPSFSSSSMEELQSAIQGAIAHCKNSMLQQQNKCNTSSSSAIVEI